MPVKRRLAKRRVDPRAELEAWECIFDSHHDFFGDLRRFGVPLDPYGRPDDATAREAWNRLGQLYLDSRPPNPRPPWALEAFGEPDAH
ncbi:MAG: hypothetical protein ACR2JJ_05045 [Sphingomicrobium sp.]